MCTVSTPVCVVVASKVKSHISLHNKRKQSHFGHIAEERRLWVPVSWRVGLCGHAQPEISRWICLNSVVPI